eukprot:2211735-Pyramimonas_sp.AAC.1
MKQVAHRLPPRVLRGRLGSIHEVGAFFLRASQPETSTVFNKVFDPKGTASPAPRPVDPTLTEDANGEDYATKLTRWKNDAVKAANDLKRWALMAATQ